jgi:hypothetical protein
LNVNRLAGGSVNLLVLEEARGDSAPDEDEDEDAAAEDGLGVLG